MGDSRLLQGAYDFHVHCAPDVVPRAQSLLELANDARRAGLAGLVIKDHTGSTVGQACVLNETYPNGPRFFGSLTLNPPVGGLNPYAVETALRLGAAVVFFPTYSARHQIETMGITGFPDAFPWRRTAESGIQILQMDETPRSDVVAIVELVARYDAALATGHLSPGESIALLQLARQRGVRRMIVTHASESVPGMSVAEQQEATRCGALIEHCFMAVTDCCPNRISLEEMASQVRQVGVEHVVLSSDFGQMANGPPVEGFGRWLGEMLACGFSERELHVMVADNPARLLEGRAKPAAETGILKT